MSLKFRLGKIKGKNGKKWEFSRTVRCWWRSSWHFTIWSANSSIFSRWRSLSAKRRKISMNCWCKLGTCSTLKIFFSTAKINKTVVLATWWQISQNSKNLSVSITKTLKSWKNKCWDLSFRIWGTLWFSGSSGLKNRSKKELKIIVFWRRFSLFKAGAMKYTILKLKSTVYY